MKTISATQAGNPPPDHAAGGGGSAISAPNLALYQIESRLSELLEMRNAAVEDEAAPEVLAAIDEQFAQYFAKEVRKVDGICHALCAFEDAAEQAEIEAARIAARAKHLRAQHDRIKAATLKAMQDHGVRVLETPTNKLRVCANGGLEPLVISDTIPEQYRRAIIKMPLSEWMRLREAADIHGYAATPGLLSVTSEADMETLRAALKRGEEVPGAKLLPRGFHLRID